MSEQEAVLPQRPRLHRLAEQVGLLEALDGPAESVARAVRGAIPRGAVKDALSGTWLGHALHPLLTDVPIGTWTSSLLVDVLGGREGRRASERLIAVGVLASLPTAATGMSDWADTTPADDSVRRVGAAHAAANVAALGLYAGRWRLAAAGVTAPASRSGWPGPARSPSAVTSADICPTPRPSGSTRPCSRKVPRTGATRSTTPRWPRAGWRR